MEPMNCTAHVRTDACEVWAPTQNQTRAQEVAAEAAGIPKEKVRIHTTLLGGGFGRRLESDFVAEAVQLSKAAKAPVKVIWSREDDVKHGFYRPATYNRLTAGLDATNEVMVAKWWASEGGQRVVHITQHLHGGMGADVDYPVHRYFLWGKQIEDTLGGASAQLARLGRALAEAPA